MTEQHAEAASIWFVGIADDFEQKLLETECGESGNFRSRKRPWHLTFRLGRFAAAGKDEQQAARPQKPSDVFSGLRAKRRRQNLKRVCFENEIKPAAPILWRLEEICSLIFDARIRKSFSARANGGFRNVEGRSAKTPSCELLSVIAKSAASYQRRFSFRW